MEKFILVSVIDERIESKEFETEREAIRVRNREIQEREKKSCLTTKIVTNESITLNIKSNYLCLWKIIPVSFPDNSDKYFAEITWSEEDIKTILSNEGFLDSEENIERVLELLKEDELLSDTCIDAGFDIITTKIRSIKEELTPLSL